MNRLNVLITSAVFIFMVAGVLIPCGIGDGVSSLPGDKQKYGEAAIRSAYMVLDHPLQKFLARRLKVQSVNMDDALTGKIDAEVKAYTFWGVPVARIKMSGRNNPGDSVNMGFTNIWID